MNGVAQAPPPVNGQDKRHMLECSVLYLLIGKDDPLVIDMGSSSMDEATVPREAKKAPIPGMSENGREMLELYEQLPEREQLIFIGRLQEAVARLAGPASKEVGLGPRVCFKTDVLCGNC